jgi:MFS transporter, DHA3 family, macrolide efflux protein
MRNYFQKKHIAFIFCKINGGRTLKRNVYIISFNQFLTTMADSLFFIVLYWFIYKQTDSAIYASLVTVIQFSIQAIVSPILGVFADRLDPRKTMQFSFLLMAALGVLFIPVYYFAQTYLIVFIYAVIAVHTCCMSLEFSAKNKLIPQFVHEKDIIKTNGYISSLGNGASLLGNSLGGIMLVAISLMGVMIIQSSLYVFAALSLVYLLQLHTFNARVNDLHTLGDSGVTSNHTEFKYTEESTEFSSRLSEESSEEVSSETSFTSRSSFMTELIEGFVMLRKNKAMFKLTLLSCVLNIAMLNASLLVVLVSDHYHGTSMEFGYFNAFGVLGSILMGLCINQISVKFKVNTLFTASLLLNGIATLLMGLFTSIPVGIFFYMLLMCATSVTRITFNSFLMICVEKQFRGRMMALTIALSAVIVPFIALLGGYLSDHAGVAWVYVLSGLWVVVWSIFPLVDKDLRAIHIAARNM